MSHTMPKVIQVLEYGTLQVGVSYQGVQFEKTHWESLFDYHDEHTARRYYDMRHDGVRFRSYVGVIQAGDLTIEILPKVDDVDTVLDSTLTKWRDILLRMLHESGTLKLDSLSTAYLREKANSLLDLYLALFLNEIESLLHRGLVKRYRHTEGQQKALRGAIQFGQHIARNLVHQEHFYTRHQTYDHQHLHNQLLRQALVLLPRLTASPTLRGRAARALLAWSESPALKVTAATFTRLTYNRKTEAYRPALTIAQLLLLNYRPDLRGGSSDLIALLFNMNQLWERYLLRTMQRLFTPHGWTISKPDYKAFWASKDGGIISQMQPDLLAIVPGQGNIVLDAKWKRPHGHPHEHDLRQLYAYAHYYEAKHTLLLYPYTPSKKSVTGSFQPVAPKDASGMVQCDTVFVRVGDSGDEQDDSSFDKDGYLRCSLLAQFQDWLNPITVAVS